MSPFAVIFLLIYPGCIYALGNFEYCCDIKRCEVIRDACNAYEGIVGEKTCSEACLPTSFNCAPLASLATRDYSCFGPYLNYTEGSPLKLVCNQTYLVSICQPSTHEASIGIFFLPC